MAKSPFFFYYTRKKEFVHNLFTHAFVVMEGSLYLNLKKSNTSSQR